VSCRLLPLPKVGGERMWSAVVACHSYFGNKLVDCLTACSTPRIFSKLKLDLSLPDSPDGSIRCLEGLSYYLSVLHTM
jgi:hypothetical protein